MSGAPSMLPDDTQPLSVLPSTPAASAQAVWFAVQGKPWSSLAVVPAGHGESALAAGNALYDVGVLASGGPMKLLDGRSVTLATSASFIVNMTSLLTASGDRRPQAQRLVVVLASVLEQPASIPIALAADAVVVTVTLGTTSLDDARQTLELVGAEHVLGCITLSP
ncbi:MAG TPA: hypothetical protein VEJ89_17650 [Myxococcaceae bacterium]|jgi:hypothetical protein|nr:hypothetical protein [Myxococcaceae bacterium]